MPELPEVETVRKILNTFIIGAEVSGVEVRKPGIINGDVDTFIKTITGQTFGPVERIGKYLIFTFASDLILLSHLRMEGKYVEVVPGEKLSPYAHVIFTFTDGRKLCYDDSRQFGTMELTTKATYLHTKSLQNVGKEPFDTDPKEYFNSIKSRTTPIKLTLLDQKLMSGLGNIYVDEVLYAAQIHPLFPTNKLTYKQVALLVTESVNVLNEAIKQGGTTVRSYHPSVGVSGNFQQQLHAYGRADQKCIRCGGLMKKIFVGGRGTTYCPTCQVNPYAPRVIAITGQKAAGKSVILDYLKTSGHEVHNTDIIAKDLYKDVLVRERLSLLLGLDLEENGTLNIKKLREHLLANPKDIKIINNYIHPLVKEQMVALIKKSSAIHIYFEVPLVFSKKINELFDYIIGVEVSASKQLSNLALRGQTLGLNPDQEYLKNRHKVDYIIVNDGSIEELISKFKAFKH